MSLMSWRLPTGKLLRGSHSEVCRASACPCTTPVTPPGCTCTIPSVLHCSIACYYASPCGAGNPQFYTGVTKSFDLVYDGTHGTVEYFTNAYHAGVWRAQGIFFDPSGPEFALGVGFYCFSDAGLKRNCVLNWYQTPTYYGSNPIKFPTTFDDSDQILSIQQTGAILESSDCPVTLAYMNPIGDDGDYLGFDWIPSISCSKVLFGTISP